MYVDGFLIPIPKKSIATYRKIAKLAGKVWKEYGAHEYVECVADELETKHDGKVMKSIFPKMAGTKAGETVVLSWILQVEGGPHQAGVSEAYPQT